MHKPSVKKLFLLVGTLVLVLVAFTAGGIAMASAHAASVNAASKGGPTGCDLKSVHCKGGGQDLSSNQTKAVVLVTSVSGNTIRATVQQPADQQGQTLTITTTASTSYKPDRSVVAVGKTLFVLGTVNGNGSVTALELGLYDPTAAEIGGVITAINGTTITVNAKDKTLTIRLTDSTSVLKADAPQAGVKETQTHPAARSDLRPGETIFATGRLNSDGSLTAAKIVIIPAGNNAK